MKFRTLILILSSLLFCSFSYGNSDSTLSTGKTIQQINDELPWSVTAYVGRMANNTLLQVLTFNTGGLTNDELYSLELSRRLASTNPVSQFLNRFGWVSSIELNGNLTYHDDPAGAIYEANPYFSLRWANFPWDKYLGTSFAIGEGVSYASRVSTTEAENTRSGETQHLLNYLMFEVAFSLPNHPQWELLTRLHHRSGAFGLYNARNSGSTAVGLGVRYRF